MTVCGADASAQCSTHFINLGIRLGKAGIDWCSIVVLFVLTYYEVAGLDKFV